LLHCIEVVFLKQFWPSCDGCNHGGKLFSSDIGTPDLRVKILKGVVSQDKGFIEWLSMKRVVGVVELMHLLPQ